MTDCVPAAFAKPPLRYDWGIDHKNKVLIWEYKGPLPCFEDDPLNELNWLKTEISRIPTRVCDHVRIYQCNYGDGLVGFLTDQVGYYYSFRDCTGFVRYSGAPSNILYDRLNGIDLKVDLINKKLIWEFKR